MNDRITVRIVRTYTCNGVTGAVIEATEATGRGANHGSLSFGTTRKVTFARLLGANLDRAGVDAAVARLFAVEVPDATEVAEPVDENSAESLKEAAVAALKANRYMRDAETRERTVAFAAEAIGALWAAGERIRTVGPLWSLRLKSLDCRDVIQDVANCCGTDIAVAVRSAGLASFRARA